MDDVAAKIDLQKAFTAFTSECSTFGEIARNNHVDPSTLFMKAWRKFVEKYQTSPSRVNNNIFNRDNGRRILENRVCQVQKDSNSENISCLGQTSGRGISCIKPSFLDFSLHFLTFVFHIIELLAMVVIVLAIFYVAIVLHKPTQLLVSRNSQDLIYPVMRLLRLLALPIITRFPHFTELYEESCLITNPNYLSSYPYECWPCESVNHVRDLTGFSNFTGSYYHGGIPFVVKDSFQSAGNIDDIKSIFSNNPDLFPITSVSVNSNVDNIHSFNQIFSYADTGLQHKHFQSIWKINQASKARILRTYFRKPYFIPLNAEVSIQHFLLFDGFNSSSYSLPMTEFANVFLMQAIGRRRILLVPTFKCRKICKVISFIIEQGDVFFYNWLYWRPHSRSISSSNLELQAIGLSYLGSFY